MQATEWVWIALGSNLAPRERYLAAGRAGVAAVPGVEVVAASRIRETAPIGPEGQGPYLNQMVLVRATTEPEALLVALQRIERAAGRRRGARWGPRTLDLDIVRFGDRHLATPTLTLPHPELDRRPFWLSQMEELSVHVQ